MAKTITKKDLSLQLHQYLGLSKSECQCMVDCFFDSIKEFLQSHQSVKLKNLGMFSVKRKAERMGRNPKTLKPHLIKGRYVVVFRASRNLKIKMIEN